MKKNLLSIIVLCLVLLTSGCTNKDTSSDTLDKILKRGKIIVGVKYDTKPFGYINAKHELAGYDVDLAKYIAKSILGKENDIEFKQVTSSNRIFALNSGKVDIIIATMTITDQRKTVVDFSLPYYMAGQAILVPKNSKINSISDLNGKKVIIILGSTAENNLKIIAPNSDILGFKTYTEGYKALKNGRADAMFSDDAILLGFVADDPSIKLLPQRYTNEPYSIAFRKGAESTRLINKINFILEYMKKSGELQKLGNKWTKY